MRNLPSLVRHDLKMRLRSVRRLDLPPVIGIQQGSVILQEFITQLTAQPQEFDELLREHIVRTHIKPWLGTYLFIVVTRCRQIAKPAFRHQAQLVIVIEDHPAMTRYTEVLQQQITGKDIAERQIPDRLAVVANRPARCRRLCFTQVDIKRLEAALNLAEVNDQIITIQATGIGCRVHQFVKQLRCKARARKT